MSPIYNHLIHHIGYSSMMWLNQWCSRGLTVCVCMCPFVVSLFIVLSFHVQNID